MSKQKQIAATPAPDISRLTHAETQKLVTDLHNRATKQKSGPLFPWIIGKAYIIRTVTMIDIGLLVAVTDKELVLESAAWVADTGRFGNALLTGKLSEVEPFPDGIAIVGRGGMIDATQWNHPLPRSQK